MTAADVQAWLDRYVEAWRTYDPALIGGLFAEDADYRWHPWDEPTHGRAAIVAAWLAPNGDESNRDAPESWRASYRPLSVGGDFVVVTGTSTYLTASGDVDQEYLNLWLLRFDESGQCTDFTEWYMQQPRS